MSFDGSYRRDTSCLAVSSLDGFVSVLAAWERPERAPADWRVDRTAVDDAVAEAMERFQVLELAVDPPGWHAEIDAWLDTYGDVVVEFPTNQRARMAPACDRFRSGVLEGTLSHDGDGLLASHIRHCVAKETPYGVVITKAHPDSPRRIDCAVASVIAFARASWWAANEPPKANPFLVARR